MLDICFHIKVVHMLDLWKAYEGNGASEGMMMDTLRKMPQCKDILQKVKSKGGHTRVPLSF